MKEIELTQGKFAIVDDDDYEKVNEIKWHYIKAGTGYAAGYINKRYVYMHRFILGDPYCENGLVTDHKNRNGLDNRKVNIWFCDHNSNMRNCRIYKNNKSGFRGVCWEKARGKWVAQITVNGKVITIGRYKDARVAHQAYLDYSEKEGLSIR